MTSFNIFSSAFIDLFRKNNSEDYLSKKDDPYIQCDRALWRGVILQAIIDLINNSKRTEYAIAKIEAKKWIFTNNEDFEYVCKMASYNSNYVRKKVLEIMRKNLISKINLQNGNIDNFRERKFSYYGLQISSNIFKNPRSYINLIKDKIN